MGNGPLSTEVSGLRPDVLDHASEFVERVYTRAPAEYLRLWRLQLAATLLHETDLKVAEIGRRVGYAAEAAFSRSFKRQLGVSPEAWRRGAAG